ncbi:hypothetical protein MNB_SV-5-1398 [hydrothermal vent metagenome]|uniref:Cytochrome C n=1 Tax=hydrothermal vent metagenome TaxID=652676 RepID=A0A1W1ECW2_9ZZZZ
MKLLWITLFVGTTLFATSALAGNVEMGQKIYGKKLKDDCGFSGVKFTAAHTPAEWQKIYDDGKLEAEIRKICPNVKEIDPVWLDHLQAFVYEFGKGSGNEPTCG